MLLDEKAIQDSECNFVIKTYCYPNDYIIFNSELLHNHLKNIIPENHFIYSTTININSIKDINQYSKNHIVVLNYRNNNNNNYLRQLKYPQNIEIICGEACIDNCPNQFQHYKTYSKINLNLPLTEEDFIKCPFVQKENITPNELLSQILSRESAITNKRIDELSDMGFQYFKISGRFSTTEMFFRLVLYYLIKEKYYEKVYDNLVKITKKNILQYKIKSQL